MWWCHLDPLVGILDNGGRTVWPFPARRDFELMIPLRARIKGWLLGLRRVSDSTSFDKSQ